MGWNARNSLSRAEITSIVVIIVDDGVKLYFVLVKFDLIAVNRDRE